MYKMLLPIGDWSDDGHGKCTYYTVVSNKPIEEVREAHFKSKELLNIEEIACEYGDSELTTEQLDKLLELGFTDADITSAWGVEFLRGDYYVMEKDMVDIWIFLLKKADPELKIELTEDLEMVPFYGYDEHKRHIGFIGYGVSC